MLPVQFRLKNRKEFNDIFRQGKMLSNGTLAMKYVRAGTKELKIGFSVGLKFSKKALKRNRVKRWLREAVRSLLKNMRTGYKIIFLINPRFPYEQMSYLLIQENMENLLRKEKLIK
jgi:ribonuclease P protein component